MEKMKQMIKKKKVSFPLIFFGQIIIFIAIANIFGLETGNSLLGGIYAVIMFFTLMWFLIKIIKDHKTELNRVTVPLIGISIIWVLYLAIASLICVGVSIVLSVLFGNI